MSEFVDPWKNPMHGLAAKAVLSRALAGADGITVVFIFGSVAASSERTDSDLDLFVVGAIEGRELSRLTSRLSDEALGRVLNIVHYTESELCARLAARNHFVRTVLAGPKLTVAGSMATLDRYMPMVAPDP